MTPSEATTTALTRCIIELWRVLAEREETVHRLQASNTELLERARKAEDEVKVVRETIAGYSKHLDKLEKEVGRPCAVIVDRQAVKLIRNKDTEENRAFWEALEKSSAEVASWPAWKKSPDCRLLDPVFCEHANENPARCYCPPNCYCQANTCKDRPKEARGVRGYAGDPP